MRVVRYLQHWLSGPGARLQVMDFVPIMHPIRQWADTFPWVALVTAIEQSFDQRFPKNIPAWSTARAHPRLARPGVAQA